MLWPSHAPTPVVWPRRGSESANAASVRSRAHMIGCMRHLQIVIVANGPHQSFFEKIVAAFDLYERVAVVDFDERLSRLAYAGSDFMLMPSLFEPCGLPQMTSPLYGSLPVVHSTGGLYDTIRPLDPDTSTGNGFRFDHYGSDSLRWAIDRAMDFHALPADVRQREISRIMRESLVEFNHAKVAKDYIAIYEKMLARPLVEKEAGETQKTALAPVA